MKYVAQLKIYIFATVNESENTVRLGGFHKKKKSNNLNGQIRNEKPIVVPSICHIVVSAYACHLIGESPTIVKNV